MRRSASRRTGETEGWGEDEVFIDLVVYFSDALHEIRQIEIAEQGLKTDPSNLRENRVLGLFVAHAKAILDSSREEPRSHSGVEPAGGLNPVRYARFGIDSARNLFHREDADAKFPCDLCVTKTPSNTRHHLAFTMLQWDYLP